jgi:EmrB/QacA subfamily drug resistance transporter
MKTKALALLCIVDFMVILDSQIVILGIPPIQEDLGFSADGVQWVLSAYLISFGGLLLLGGRTGDLLGRRRVLLAATACFGLSSLLCGLALTPAVLVAGRVIQGASAAMMAPTALAILMTTFAEGPERNRAIAFWGATGGLGATAALLVGGTLVDLLGWRSIFLINVPVALLLLAAGPRVLQEGRARAGQRRYDLAGALTITLAIACLIYAVVEVPDEGWLNPLFGVAGALLAAFIWIEQTVESPLVPLRLFRSRTLVGGNTVSVLAGIAAWGQGLLVSLYAQDVLGYSAIEFGLGSSVMTAGTLVGSFTAQRLANRIGLFPIAAASMALMGAGLLLLAGIDAGGSYFTDLFPGLLVFGPGLGAGTVAASIAALSGVPERDAGVASGTNTAAFQIGGALGAAIATSVAATHAAGSPTNGFQAAFLAAALATVAGVVAATLLRARPRVPSRA